MRISAFYVYELTDNTTWFSGYWTAWLWQMYNQTKDPQFKEAAETHYEGYNWRFNTPSIHCHDVGVIYDMGAVRGYTVTGDEKWKNLAIRAASFLATRFKMECFVWLICTILMKKSEKHVC